MKSLSPIKIVLMLLLTVALAACSTGTTSDTAASVTSTPPSIKFNLNTASASDFQTIPNVGSRMTREFLEYRPYTSLAQFRREMGKYVEAAQIAEYEKYVFVPVDMNAADADTLQQLPGVDSTIAAELIAGRPYATLDDFAAQLAKQLNSEQLATAKNYLVAP